MGPALHGAAEVLERLDPVPNGSVGVRGVGIGPSCVVEMMWKRSRDDHP